MNRRTLLATISMGAATVAGCAGESDGTDRPEYEECDISGYIHYTSLPEDVRDEVDVALNQGRYESDRELLWEQVAGPRVEGIVRGNTYYASQVDVDDGVHILQLEETTPQYESTKHLIVSDAPEGSLNVSITVRNAEGTVLEETELTIEDGHSDQRVPVASEFGRYMVEVTVEGWGSVTESLRLGPSPGQILLSIREDNEAESSFSVSIQTRADKGSDSYSCPWE